MMDDAILDLYFERSEEALAATMEKYGTLLRSLAWNILGNEEDVEECVSDTYMAAWETIRLNGPSTLKRTCARSFAISRSIA